MGLIADSSIVIGGERKGRTVEVLLAEIEAALGPSDVAISVVSVVELEHGVWRARDERQGAERRRFLDDLFAAVPTYPLTFSIARLAARIDGQARHKGIQIPFQDLLIGATALEFGYAVATSNLRHFRLIPDLIVKPFP